MITEEDLFNIESTPDDDFIISNTNLARTNSFKNNRKKDRDLIRMEEEIFNRNSERENKIIAKQLKQEEDDKI